MKTLKKKTNILDIETTGLAGTDEIVCFIYNGIQEIQSKDISEKDLLLLLSGIVKDGTDDTIVTVFGEPKYGSVQGFDIPMIRTRYIMNDIVDYYPFSGFHHVDLLDVAKKYFNTKKMQEPRLELLSAAQITELTIECDLHPMKTMAANIKQLKNEETVLPIVIDTFIRENVELKATDDNSMDHMFKMFFPGADESLLDEEYSGKDMPMLFKKFKETGEQIWLTKILEHNMTCAYKTESLYKVMVESGLVNTLSIPTTRL